MKRSEAKTLLAAAFVLAALAVAIVGLRSFFRGWHHFGADKSTCGAGFARLAARCCVILENDASFLEKGTCPRALSPSSCPPPLVVTPRGCDAPLSSTVLVVRSTVMIGPSDWEAEGRVTPRVVEAGPFRIDRLEISVGRAFCPSCPLPKPEIFDRVDPARAASDVTRDEARSFCIERGGRLPTEEEWIVAAAGERPRRYPWGDTGAVCRRAAWGLATGPCAMGATAPDTVGAHPDGATPSGIHDLAGNVAEWVEAPCDLCAVVRGGSFESALAADLRTWQRSEVPEGARSPAIGFRCAYDADDADSTLP